MLDEHELRNIREDTVGVNGGVFFNSAGASLRPQQVTQVVKDFLDQEDLVGGHQAAYDAKAQLTEVYSLTAKLINAKPQDIALMESNTRAWHSIIHALDLQTDDEIIVSVAEYETGYLALTVLARRYKIKLKVIGYTQNGSLDLDALKAALTQRTKLVVLTHISTSNGTIHPVAKAGEIIKQHSSAFYLLDACQSVGQVQSAIEQQMAATTEISSNVQEAAQSTNEFANILLEVSSQTNDVGEISTIVSSEASKTSKQINDLDKVMGETISSLQQGVN